MQRVAATAVGCFLAFAAVLSCLTDLGQGAQVERAGALAVLVSLLLAGLGVYLAAAGVWGGWSPGGNEGSRVRSLRLALSWVALTSLVLCLAMPLTNPAVMTRTEWLNLGLPVGYLAIAVFTIVAVRRVPRVTVVFLGIGSAYAGTTCCTLFDSWWRAHPYRPVRAPRSASCWRAASTSPLVRPFCYRGRYGRASTTRRRSSENRMPRARGGPSSDVRRSGADDRRHVSCSDAPS